MSLQDIQKLIDTNEVEQITLKNILVKLEKEHKDLEQQLEIEKIKEEVNKRKELNYACLKQFGIDLENIMYKYIIFDSKGEYVKVVDIVEDFRDEFLDDKKEAFEEWLTRKSLITVKAKSFCDNPEPFYSLDLKKQLEFLGVKF